MTPPYRPFVVRNVVRSDHKPAAVFLPLAWATGARYELGHGRCQEVTPRVQAPRRSCGSLPSCARRPLVVPDQSYPDPLSACSTPDVRRCTGRDVRPSTPARSRRTPTTSQTCDLLERQVGPLVGDQQDRSSHRIRLDAFVTVLFSGVQMPRASELGGSPPLTHPVVGCLVSQSTVQCHSKIKEMMV
jgi:hypothetical protein